MDAGVLQQNGANRHEEAGANDHEDSVAFVGQDPSRAQADEKDKEYIERIAKEKAESGGANAGG